MTIEITFDGNKRISAKVGDMIVHTDQPVKAGGEGTAASPFELFLASIGTCAGFYIKSFCDQRSISTDNIKLLQQLSFNRETHMVDRIDLEVYLPADFPEKYKDALINAAEVCTVKKHLVAPPEIKVVAKTV
jgi:putative redox protein